MHLFFPCCISYRKLRQTITGMSFSQPGETNNIIFRLKTFSSFAYLNLLKYFVNSSFKALCENEGKHLHQFAINEKLTELNLKILRRITNLTGSMVDLDYDNTVCYTEKEDAQITYKKCHGYVPGVALVGSNIVYVENRNGRSNAGILQSETLDRMFMHLESHNIKTDRFRADSASYEFRTIQVIARHTNKFYVRARMSAAMDTVISSIREWEAVGNEEDGVYRGATFYTPFQRAARDYKIQDELHNYRFIVTKERRKDGQINTFTGEACIYSIIMTNDEESEPDTFYLNLLKPFLLENCQHDHTFPEGLSKNLLVYLRSLSYL